MKHVIKTSNITQVTLLTNVTCYQSNEVTVMSLILSNFTSAVHWCPINRLLTGVV